MEKFTFTNEYIKQFRNEKYETLNWNKTESTNIMYRKYRENFFKGCGRLFTRSTILKKLKKSLFGQYLKTFNIAQMQTEELNLNKLGISKYDYKNLNENERNVFEKDNDIVEDLFESLKDFVMQNDVVDIDTLFNYLTQLTVREVHITNTDDWLRNFKKLHTLTLTSNWIDKVDGSHLPRNLHFLELYNNNISSLETLAHKPPHLMFYLGLARNKLKNQDSKLHLLVETRKFLHLRALDLSSNDIYNLEDLLREIGGLQSMQCLNLIDNPCSVVISYRDMILNTFPNLMYLDDTHVLPEDKMLNSNYNKLSNTAQIIFKCHRILGLAAPPKEKATKQTLHFEIDLPLLEEVHYTTGSRENIRKMNAKTGTKATTAKFSKKSKSSKKGFNPYGFPNEYTPEFEKLKFYSFTTSRVPWKKNIEIPPLYLESPENNLRAINDSFKTVVNLRLVYLKWLPPGKSGRKANKKGSTKDKDSKKNKSNKSSGKSETSSKKEEKKKEEPKEKILKRVTIANFFCNLHPINWSDDSIDFYWANHPEANPTAIKVNGSLAAILYGKPQKEKKMKKGKNTEESPEPTASQLQFIARTMKQPVPLIFTIQVGFGLKRTPNKL